MEKAIRITPPGEIERQRAFSRRVGELLRDTYAAVPKAYVRTYGCQQNVSDSQRLSGMLAEMGYALCGGPEDADLILFNTCAVRAHAEDRVFGNIGALKAHKRRRPGMVIAVCGCMTQQGHAADKIRAEYPFVDLVFGTHALYRLPELLHRVLASRGRVFELTASDGEITEGVPVRRDGIRGWLPVMYGCDNFCAYCVVPYVRGRERSRSPRDVLAEAKEMIAGGFKDITLLGQNVNSYRPPDSPGYDFAALLRDVCALPGEFTVRFMTSHPKDCTPGLLEAMRDCEKAAKHLHLPFQSGSDRILQAMNRGYTAEAYLALARKAKELMPELLLTSDVIVGFPGEDAGDFEKTVELVEKVRFASLFTFIYPPREGTPAAKLPDPVSRAQKQEWFDRLLRVQEKITAGITASLVGQTLRVLCEGPGKRKGTLAGRTSGNLIVEFEGECGTGAFSAVLVTGSNVRSLTGKAV